MQGAAAVVEYEQNGFVVLEKFLDANTLLSISEEAYVLLKNGGVAIEAGVSFETIGKALIGCEPTQLTTFRRLWARSDAVLKTRQQIVRDPVVRQVCGGAAGIQSTTAFFSLPSSEWVLSTWHQERYANSETHAVAHIALVDTNDKNGGLKLAKYNRSDGMLPHEELPTRNGTLQHKQIVNADQMLSPIQLHLRAGDMVLFDGFAPHAGGINKSDGVRFVVVHRLARF